MNIYLALRRHFLLLVLLLCAASALADEGMWLYNAFPAAKVKARYRLPSPSPFSTTSPLQRSHGRLGQLCITRSGWSSPITMWAPAACTTSAPPSMTT